MLAERFNLTERQELPFEENKNKKEAVRIEELLKTHTRYLQAWCDSICKSVGSIARFIRGV